MLPRARKEVGRGLEWLRVTGTLRSCIIERTSPGSRLLAEGHAMSRAGWGAPPELRARFTGMHCFVWCDVALQACMAFVDSKAPGKSCSTTTKYEVLRTEYCVVHPLAILRAAFPEKPYMLYPFL